MKSVHSSKATPYRQPVEQSRGRIIARFRTEDLLLRTRETDKKRTPSVWQWVRSCLFPHLDYKVSRVCQVLLIILLLLQAL